MTLSQLGGNNMRKDILFVSSILVLLVLQIQSVRSQTTEFSYQGFLKSGTAPANGNHDFEFLLFNELSGGSQIGSTIALNNVALTDGRFSVKLNFGNQFTTGANRFLEIRLRPSGQGGITILSPRQLINSSPYSVKSLGALNAESATAATTALTANNALQLGGIAAGQYVLTTDPRMGDARSPTPGSANYVQNGTSPQASSNFNISNTGTANVFNAAAQYNLGGIRVLSNPGTGNFFAGAGAGTANAAGFQNSFFGFRAGIANNAGSNNTFAGANSGAANTGGSANTFFGANSGQTNTFGGNNSFFGEGSGKFNTDGLNNSFFGRSSGLFNTEGDHNSFFGESAGVTNTIGNGNAYFGYKAGSSSTEANQNAFFGAEAGMNSTGAGGNALFGYRAGASSTVTGLAFFGYKAGESNTAGEGNTFVGFRAGNLNTTGHHNTVVGHLAGISNVGGLNNVFVGNGSGSENVTGHFNTFVGNVSGGGNVDGDSNTLVGNSTRVTSGGLSYATAIGAGAAAPASNSITLGRSLGEDTVRIPGTLVLGELSAAGLTPVCRNAFLLIGTCASSARYKSNINPFGSGLNLIRRLRPVSFNWKDGGILDFGLVAEDVAEVEPLLVTRNDKGEIEGVKYDRVGVVLVNAVKEQQQQIDILAEQLNEQKEVNQKLQKQIDLLIKRVCRSDPSDEICKLEGVKP